MQTFPIAPASFRALWLLLPVVVIPLLIAAVVVTKSLRGMRGARFDVSDQGLRLSGDFYGRTIPVSDLRGGAARRVDLETDSEFRPRWRTLGTGMPGYSAGWFRLRNGEKALLYLTDRTKAVYIPTRLDYSVLVSPDDPEAFLSAIRSVAPGQ